MSTERPHAERSASQQGSLAVCPGYRPQPSGKRAHWVTEQGTRGHAALESGDSGDLESGFEERMVAMAEEYASRFTELGSETIDEFRVETIEGRWGYCDRLVICADGTAHLFDWKFVRAKEVVDADHNLQGKDYVVGIFEDFRFSGIQKLHVHFVMPRLGTVTRTTQPFTRADVPTLKLEILAILSRAKATDTKKFRGATLNPSYDVCRYCGAAGRCVALRRIADTLGRAYDPENYGKKPEIPTQTHASEVRDPAARAQLQELAGLMETWAASVRHHNLTAALADEKNIPAGYVVDWAQGRRRVTSAEGLLLAAQEFGISAQDLIDAASLSWTKVEETLRSRAARGEKAQIVSAFSQRLVELDAVQRPEPSPKLVRARPPRV